MSKLEHRAEQVKGDVKQAAGDLLDNDDLKREGAVDRASGAAKDKIEDGKDKIEDAIDRVKARIEHD